MKIRSVEAVYPGYRHIAPSWRTDLWQIIVRIESDSGLVGYGCGGGGMASLPIVNGHFRELLEGVRIRSRRSIETVWDWLYRESIPYGRKGVAVMALSGIDLALWDLLGKAERKPVAQLLSDDVRPVVACYGTGADPEYHAELGFRGTKTPHRWSGDHREIEALIEWAGLARRLMGSDGLLMIDSYMSWDSDFTVSMAETLDDYRVHWFEDVLTPDDLSGQSELRKLAGQINIAGGEHEFTDRGFRDIALAGALDIWQPDITWCGGLTAGLRIVELSRQWGAPVVPHRGAEVWGLHLIAATECENLAEFVTGPRNASRDQVWTGEPEPVGGSISIGDAPGFGVEPDPRLL